MREGRFLMCASVTRASVAGRVGCLSRGPQHWGLHARHAAGLEHHIRPERVHQPAGRDGGSGSGREREAETAGVHCP